jgi:hypothetical protein
MAAAQASAPRAPGRARRRTSAALPLTYLVSIVLIGGVAPRASTAPGQSAA